MGFELTIAGRHLRSIRGRPHALFTTGIAVGGVGIGVAALVIVLSVMNGYSGMIWDRQVGMTPHITVRRAYGEPIRAYGSLLNHLRSHPEVLGSAPYVRAEGFVRGKPTGGQAVLSGVVVRGVDPDRIEETSEIGRHVHRGGIELGRRANSDGTEVYGVLIGGALAEKLGAGVGAEVHLVLAPRDRALDRVPPLRRYVVTGVFDTGYYEFDSGLVYVALSAAQRDLGWGHAITGVEVRLKDPFRADLVSVEVQEMLGEAHPGLFAGSWMHLQGNLYAWIWLQKWASFVVLSLIVVVASFNVISILTMRVAERRREIGILKAMGSTPRSIGRIFTLEGLAVGLGGVLAGDLLGFILCRIQQIYSPIRLSGEVYFIDALPVRMSVLDFSLVSGLAVGVCFLFTLWPSRSASALDPVEAIRYE